MVPLRMLQIAMTDLSLERRSKKEFSQQSVSSSLHVRLFQKMVIAPNGGQLGIAGSLKIEKKADCFTLLTRITGLKCANSGIKSNVRLAT